jgi:PAS domain S-box-containing protein
LSRQRYRLRVTPPTFAGKPALAQIILRKSRTSEKMGYSDLVAGALLKAGSDAIIAADQNNIVRFWNPGAERIFGYTHDEAVGQSLDIIIPERLRKRHWDGYQRVMAGGDSRYSHGDILAVPGVRKDGTAISIEFTIAPLADNAGLLTGMVAVIRDVTAKFEEMRALRRKLAEASKTPT